MNLKNPIVVQIKNHQSIISKIVFRETKKKKVENEITFASALNYDAMCTIIGAFQSYDAGKLDE